MPDLHNKRAGNRGDVWKHFILASVAKELLSRHPANKPFVYVDTHCSLGPFRLQDKGEWQEGIGLFYDRQWPLGDHPYFAAQKKEFTENRSYLGSWAIVQELLRAHHVAGDLHLFDTAPSIAQRLAGMRGFSQSDGFDGALSILPADLILVDPAYSDHREQDWQRVRDVGKEIVSRNVSAIICYPVFVTERPFDEVHGALISEVRWPARSGNQLMRGCGVIACGGAGAVVRALESSLAEIASVFDACYTLRSPIGGPRCPSQTWMSGMS